MKKITRQDLIGIFQVNIPTKNIELNKHVAFELRHPKLTMESHLFSEDSQSSSIIVFGRHPRPSIVIIDSRRLASSSSTVVIHSLQLQ